MTLARRPADTGGERCKRTYPLPLQLAVAPTDQ